MGWTAEDTLQVEELGRRARAASRHMAAAGPAAKNRFLARVAELLAEREGALLAANAEDVAAARAAGLDAPRLDRLTLTPAILADMRAACLSVAGMPDPVGVTEHQWQRPNGLLVGRMRVPLGVIAMIYEARPNVTVDAAILCAKAGNAVILRGGSEAVRSNRALAGVLREALADAGLPADAVQLVATTDRAAVTALCKLDAYIDVIIPRGGEGLVRAVSEAATMPVLKHDKGVCHMYVDAGADLEMALGLVENGKTQRPGVCNALECLLVHRDEAAAFLPMVARSLGGAGVEFRADQASLPLLGPTAKPQQPEDLGHEFHALVLAVCVVDDMDAALAHIAAYGSNHSEVICTRDYGRARRFLREADASMVAVNASTRFNDGAQLGLGAEIGISTSKLHAYGPMGVIELTTTKFVVLGNGQTRQ
ncbi:MAG: glutamate-5-semialdehyde dehydrogenase [Desulfovibrio sp.]|uniref:glutamate-5-semialdehyde dehydrogenase n=1 Tax=Desulfovibrio sp. TaxID=885 RepID=UPI001A731D29|nr:glutamate-5-semialdehyde dehydrogenase [Desulfovibrio sp.]MBD5416742.1 glutamate-5-semialdehyde dehydrogenase [Desulfovibrio sp.]